MSASVRSRDPGKGTAMRRLALIVSVLCVVVPVAHAVQGRGAAPQTASPHRAVLDKYCVTCHNQRLKTGGLALDVLDLARPGEHADVWEKVVHKIRTGAMPPPGRPRP